MSEPTATGYAPVHGMQLYWESHGEGGTPVVVVHGGFGLASSLDTLVGVLSRGRRVLAVELQGHGHTADIDRPFSYEAFGDDIAAVMAHLGLDQVDLLGYSLGGGSVLRAAIQHPELVRKLVVVSFPYRRDGWFPEVLAGFDHMDRALFGPLSQSPLYAAWLKVAPDPDAFPDLIDKTGEMQRRPYDWSAEVAGISASTLLACADADSMPITHMAEFFALLGGGLRDPGWEAGASLRCRWPSFRASPTTTSPSRLNWRRSSRRSWNGNLRSAPEVDNEELKFWRLLVAVRADWLEKDLYAVLGVAADADTKAITRAYRKLARELHPDTHPDDPEAAERFKEVTAAYDVIGDEAKRAEYDEFRRAVAEAGAREARGGAGGGWGRFDDDASGWTWGQAGTADGQWQGFDTSEWESFSGGDLGDLLGSVFGGSRPHNGVRRGADLEAVLQLSFEDAVQGLTTEVSLTDAAGPRPFKVRVPAGVDDGQRIRLPGKGAPGSNGGPPGDLYAVVRVAPHPLFGRRGTDLTVDAAIGWPDAVLGTEVDVPTLEGGKVRVRVPAGTPSGRTLRVRGHGVKTAKGTGDLLVRTQITVPDQVTGEQRDAVEAVARAFRAAA